MDADTKALLDGVQQRISDELVRLLADRDAKWEQRLADSEQRVIDRLTPVESVVKVLDDWRPRFEAAIDDVKLEVSKLARYWERSVLIGLQRNPVSTPNRCWRRSTHLLRIRTPTALMGTASTTNPGTMVSDQS